jgi:beta-N-acetylhexosaminidase
VVASWPLTRRAAELVVVPILDASPDALAVAVQTHAGGVLLLGSVPPAATLQANLAALARPAQGGPLVMADEEGGGVERLAGDVQSMPWPRQMAATMTPAEVQQLADQVGHEMSALGVDTDLAPVLDVDAGPFLSAGDPDGPRSFSPDPTVAATYGLAFERGLLAAGVLPVVKHFPGLGGSSGNTDYGPAATPPLSTLQESGLRPFEQAIAAGVPAVMVANASVPGLSAAPASLSPSVVTGLLRGQLHFGGLVVTDSLSAGAITAAGYDLAEAAVAAVSAGDDMVLFGSTLTPADTAQLAAGPLASTTGQIVSALASATAAGRLPAARLDQAVLDVIQAKGESLCPS